MSKSSEEQSQHPAPTLDSIAPYDHIKQEIDAESRVSLTRFRRKMAIRQIMLDHQEIVDKQDNK